MLNYARRVIGWRAAARMDTALVLDALEHAVFTAARPGSPTSPAWWPTATPGRKADPTGRRNTSMTEVFDGTTAASGGSGSSAGDAVTWPADPGQARGAGVLAL